MTAPQSPESLYSEESFAQILDESIVEILRHQDSGRYLDWMRANAERLLGHVLVEVPERIAALAVALGRGIWNSVPLPANHFKPRPIPLPGRNDPCLCGSGRKRKHCCAQLPELGAMEPDAIWTFLIRHLNRAALAAAIHERRVPSLALAAVAQNYLDGGEPKKAVALLAPLFEQPPQHLDARLEPAFDLLCDAYLELGMQRKREALVESLVQQARGPLLRAALQRLSVMRRDKGELAGAWEAFRRAQQADPDDPSLATNEITLLMSEGRTEEAAARAKFWAARLRREGYDAELVATLEALAEDPVRGTTDLYTGAMGVELEPLRAWVARALSRPLPRYRLADLPSLDPTRPEEMRAALREHYANAGIPPEQLEAFVGKLVRDLRRQAKKTQRTPHPEPSAAESSEDERKRLLAPPEELRVVERQWRGVYAIGKPAMIAFDVDDGTDPWDADSYRDWLAFLERHPEAGDSLSILDDLATAVVLLEQNLPHGTHGGIARQLADRALAIVEEALGDADVELPWSVVQNRAPLRLLARGVDMRMQPRDASDAVGLIRLLLRVNRHDNHGFRSTLVTHLLRMRDAAGALDLIARYPDDAMLDVRYGEILAHLLRRDEPAALESLKFALEVNAHVPRYLARADAKPPRGAHAGWLACGSREEAWVYADDARDVWEATPGALKWLAKSARALKPRAR
jgi:hypothetical protein